jgi:tetratricopeptide (TPR) repeat protein
LVQPPGVPRFNEDSALKRHWPLLWLGGLSALIVATFVSDFNNLGRIFDNQGSGKVLFETQYIFNRNHERFSYSRMIGAGKKGHDTIGERKEQWLNAGERFANAVTYNGYPDLHEADGKPGNEANTAIQESRAYLKWLFHRQLGLHYVYSQNPEGSQDYEAAQSEFATALKYADQLGDKYPCKALSLSDMALLAELRSVEMQQVAQMLLKAALPIFSFLAALLPFALFLSFIRSRDKVELSRGESETAGARLCLKTMLLASWFGVIVTGWVALRNNGMGLATGLGDPTAVSFFCALGALLLSCCLMLRYMPPYKSLSLKRTMVGFGFGGVLLALKAVAIYFGLCVSLAGHPALKDVLFCEPLYLAKADQARTLAKEAEDCARRTMVSQPFLQAQVLNEMWQILSRAKGYEIDKSRVSQIWQELKGRTEQDLALPQLKNVPYVWHTCVRSIVGQGFWHRPVSLQNFSVGMTVKACLAYMLLFYPEFLAYIWLGLKQRALALRTFNWAVRVKEYFLGIDHWLVIGMMELFGSCLLTFHKQVDLSCVGEDYLRQAIIRYERSRGRHDQLTIAAKMALAHFFSERGDDKQAERILLEALRDVGKDFDTLAYCALLSELGKLFCRRNNYSRAKQMYKQVIDLLEQKLAKCPPSQGFLGYLHNIYATIPTWQLEVKLVYSYLDLAEVFHQAKYNGEAERLTDDANKRIGVFERDMVTVMEVAIAYMKARLAMAKILSDQGRYDECFKLLAGAKKQLHKWGYGRSIFYFEFVVGQCEIELAASRGLSNYFEVAKKDYLDGYSRFGIYARSGELHERWLKVGQKFGSKQAAGFAKTPAQGTLNGDSCEASAFGPAPVGSAAVAPSWFCLAPTPVSQSSAPEHAPSRASSTLQLQAEARTRSLASLSDKSSQAGGAPDKQATASSSGLKAVNGHGHNVAPSRVIRESRETQDEGIVIRWQRERKEEVMFELRPERG